MSEIYDMDYFEGDERHKREYYYPFFEEIAIRLKDKFSTSNILDIGCGKGFLVEAFEKQDLKACGIDVSKYALLGSKATTLILGSAESLPFKDDSFDLITCFEVIEHLEKPEKFVKEVKRILTPNGFLYLTTPSHRNQIARRDPTHINIKPLSEWEKILRLHGFVIDHKKQNEYLRLIAEFYSKSDPKSKFGRFLCSFGWNGRNIRKTFIYFYHWVINPYFFGVVIVAKRGDIKDGL